MRIVFINGRETTLSWHEVRAALWHPMFVALVFVTSLFVILLRPYEDVARLGAMEKTLFYANGVTTFLVLLICALKLATAQNRRVYSFQLLSFAMIGASIWGLWFAFLLGGSRPEIYSFFLVGAFNMILAWVAEIVLVSFLFDRILTDIGVDVTPRRTGASVEGDVPKAKAPPAVPETVEILGRRFMAGELWLLTAEEHYVSVSTQVGKSVLLRGNMSDAVAALPEGLGVRVHRSFWVSRQAMDVVKRSSKGWRMVLTCGQEVPVARTRQAAVAEWIAQTDSKKAPSGAPFVSRQ